MPWDKLSGDYIKGYTQAIMDIKDRILTPSMAQDCRLHRTAFNLKSVQKILSTMLEDRAIIREKRNSFIRCEKEDNGIVFKTYIPKD